MRIHRHRRGTRGAVQQGDDERTGERFDSISFFAIVLT
jgi:hypothetical protein